jgi:hypothetical protein
MARLYFPYSSSAHFGSGRPPDNHLVRTAIAFLLIYYLQLEEAAIERKIIWPITVGMIGSFCCAQISMV